MTLKSRVYVFFATLGPIGSLPMACTWGTVAAIPLLFAVRQLMVRIGFYNERLVILFLILLAWWIIEQSLNVIRGSDSSKIVIDEVIGFFVTMSNFPLSPVTIFIGFTYFRLFDVYKPFGVAYAQTMPGSLGILLDDIIAGIWSHIALFFTLQIIYGKIF